MTCLFRYWVTVLPGPTFARKASGSNHFCFPAMRSYLWQCRRYGEINRSHDLMPSPSPTTCSELQVRVNFRRFEHSNSTFERGMGRTPRLSALIPDTTVGSPPSSPVLARA